MSSSSPQRIDFSDPRQLSTAHHRLIQRWQQNSCERIAEGWGAVLAAPVTVRATSIAPVRYRVALKDLPDPGVGIVLTLADSAIPSLLSFPSPLILGILAQMFGEVTGEWPSPRELTCLEETLCDVLVQTLCDSVAEGWPGVEPLRCRVEERCRPRRCRRLPAESELISVHWEITCGHGTDSAVWLLPRKEIEELLDSEELGGAGSTGQQADLEALVLQLPIEVVVELGRTSLSMGEITRLRAGDVLVLEQSIHRPIPAAVGGKSRWSGRPCRVGSRKALQIETVIDR